MTWEMSARYVNWLQNNKASEQWAFESGVYDTSTFFRDEQGRPHHQTVPSPGARFWGVGSVGTWTGNVSVGGVSLLPRPYYSNPSSALGGGAVGLAPFHIYDMDCSPANNAYLTRSNFESSGAFVRYYGPLEIMEGGPLPTIERQVRDANGQNVWCDVSAMFQVYLLGTPRVTRTVRVVYTGSSGCLATGRYRMHVQPEGLVCSGVNQTPDVVGDYFFNIGLDCDGQNGVDAADFITPAQWSRAIDCNGNNILDTCELLNDREHVDRDNGGEGDGIIDTCQVVTNCPCNFNSDQYLNSQDFFDFLTCFFGSSCPLGHTADFNLDCVVNSQDFFDFLTCFFSGC
ncbi:MAG: hypothetical protein AB7G11_07555 [Phycisphaerales bacterium]